jgi:alkylated DNA repair protein alkB homolog 7
MIHRIAIATNYVVQTRCRQCGPKGGGFVNSLSSNVILSYPIRRVRPISLSATTAATTAATTSRSSSSAAFTFIDGYDPDPALVNAQNAPKNFVPPCAVVYKNVISKEMENALVKEILSRMKRRRYERGHWDAVITGYKEVELSDISFPTTTSTRSETSIPNLFESIRQHLAGRHLSSSVSSTSGSTAPPTLDDDDDNNNYVSWLPCHAIDLKKDGELKAHVDSIRFSGDLVAGLSLMSPSIMRLKIPPPEEDQQQDRSNDGDDDDYDRDEGHVDLLLPPRSLYALTGVGRYFYSHELLPDKSLFVDPVTGVETVVARDHRLSIIFRDGKD